MSIYISGMELPTVELGAIPVIIFADGCVENFFSHEKIGKAMPVPEHGRVGDLDALRARIARIDTGYSWDSYGNGQYDAFQDVYRCIDAAPTIIPADKEGEG